MPSVDSIEMAPNTFADPTRKSQVDSRDNRATNHSQADYQSRNTGSDGGQIAMLQALEYLPYIAPFAIATVIGGIDSAESANSVGDDFNTNTVIGVEAVATILAACCGGVIQTTPYIGHPAYKAMGGRAAYTLATALFIAGAGVIGYFSLVLQWIPEAAVLPILVWSSSKADFCGCWHITNNGIKI